MKTLKVLLQEVVSGIKAWVNSNFAQESNAVHKTGNETVNGEKTFTGNLIHQNSRSIYRNTNISRETIPEAYTAVDTYSHLGADWAYWGGLKHIWKTDGTSIIELATANHRQVNGTWNQGFWSLQLSVPKDFSNIEFIPSNDATINLGSSSKQWKSVYAKTYYYNGTQWGLDKNNTWTGGMIFSAETYNNHVLLTNTTLDLSNGNPALSETNQGMILFTDKNKWQGNTYARLQSWTASEQTVTVLAATYRPDANTETDFSVWVSNKNNDTTFHPYGVANPNLGNSTFKWKSFNGVNPGALSIPDGVDSSANSSFTPDTTNWPKDGTAFQAEMPIVGWLRISIKNVAGNYAFVRRGLAGANLPWQIFADPTFATDFAEVTLNVPVTNGTYTLRINSPGGFTAKVYPCLGNV